MPRRILVILSALTIVAGVGFSALATAPAKSTAASAAGDPRVPGLVALSPAERRIALRAMSKEDRKSIWFELKRALAAANRGQAPAIKGAGYPGRPTTPQNPATSVGPLPPAGTIQYDSGAFTTSFGGGAIVGNRFNTHTGAPVGVNGMVTQVQAVVIPGATNTTSSAGFVLLGPQTTGGGANAVFSTFTGATGSTDTVTFSGLGANYTGSSFFVLFGDFANSYIPVFGTQSANGQGHHGVVGYTGGMGPNITGTFDFGQTLNSFVRASGNILPVELMSFDID